MKKSEKIIILICIIVMIVSAMILIDGWRDWLLPPDLKYHFR